MQVQLIHLRYEGKTESIPPQHQSLRLYQNGQKYKGIPLHRLVKALIKLAF